MTIPDLLVLDFSLFIFLIIRFVESDAENGDTLTASDLVTRQYENLPYPQVKEADLLKEEDYYKRDNPTISSIFPTHILQKLNHFLYRGEQNFQ